MTDPEFEPPEEPDLLSLGIIGGGTTPSNELVVEAFMALMRHVRNQRGRYPNEGLRINIVFHIPGRFSTPDFEGVFPARFDRKTSHLLVNAAVPESLAFDQVSTFFKTALTETTVASRDYLKRRRISIDSTQVLALIEDLVAA